MLKLMLLLKPERLPDIPSPTKPPDPVFVEPMKVKPGFTPKADTQSIWLDTIGNVAGQIGGLAGPLGEAFGKSPYTNTLNNYGTSKIPTICTT